MTRLLPNVSGVGVRVVIESAYDRIFRILVLSIGLGSVVFTLLGLPGVIEQHYYLHPAFSILAITIYLGLPPLMATIAFRAPVRVLRVLAVTQATSAVVFLALWKPSMVSEYLPGDRIPWIINIITISACVAGLVLRPVVAWLFLIVLAAESGVVRFLAYSSDDASLAFQDAVMITLISGVMLSLIILALRAGRDQDAAAAKAHDAVARVATVQTLESQRARYQAFMHDDVLATLHAASRNVPGTMELTQRSAQLALDKLDEFRDGTPTHSQFTAEELESHLRSSAQRSGHELEVISRADASSLTIPVDTGDALAEALAEALRNSVRHADWPDGRPVTRRAQATFRPAGVDIEISDDGRGFLARRVGLDRLGIRVSILKRVNSQTGGFASVDSSRGHGTTVRLSWTAEGAYGAE
ncbi:ATP-binding protein [Glaciihabitans arcticus]|uniref:ATP-binding protein n=1 Tax=Glaciihabitans arcticus TaxID=2668039 RepID=A0A4Q9GVY9_9MICO|nr:ATP-binding protein [Glaciihabitans arcticus]TBN58444.1 ATP-binding protein [Glaciihabitans arcticus]